MANCEISCSADMGFEEVGEPTVNVHTNGNGVGEMVVRNIKAREVRMQIVSRSSEGHPIFGSLSTRSENFSIRELRKAGLALEGNLPGLAVMVDMTRPETVFRPEYVRTRAGGEYTILMPLTPEASALLPRR